MLNKNITIDPIDLGVHYEFLNEYEESDLIKIINSRISVINKHPYNKQWNAAWREVYDSVLDKPKYFQEAAISIENKGIFRWQQKFIKTSDISLFYKYHSAIRDRVIKQFFGNVDYILELGCGTGHNLVAIQNIRPDVKVYGCDFSKYSLKILERLGISSFHFDLRLSDQTNIPMELKENHKKVGFLTMAALEQIGPKIEGFLALCSSFKPSVCVHVEPIVELYDKLNPIDRLAIDYHNSRGYLRGFFPKLFHLGLLEFHERTYFGTVFDEGFTVLKWTP